MFLFRAGACNLRGADGLPCGLAKFDAARRGRYLLLAIFWPVLFHGTFDFFLFLGKTWLHFLGAVVSFYRSGTLIAHPDPPQAEAIEGSPVGHRFDHES